MDGLKDQVSRLPNVPDATNFPEPKKRAQGLADGLTALRGNIKDKLNTLSGEEAAAQFNSEADQAIKAVVVAPQLSAIPGEDMDEAARPQIPQNLAEAIAALNNAQVSNQLHNSSCLVFQE